MLRPLLAYQLQTGLNLLYFTRAMKTLIPPLFKKITLLSIFFLMIIFSQRSNGQIREPELTADLDSLSASQQSWERFSVSFGGFLSGYNSGITLGSKSLGLGLVIDIEDALGLETSSIVFRGNARYKFGKTGRHTVAVGYFGINRKANKVLEQELELGDITYPIGTEINSRYDLTILRAKYDYAIFQDDRVSIGISFGFFVMPVKFAVSANAIEDINSTFTAPLPLFGLRTDFRISDKLYLKQSAELLFISTDTFTGSLLDLNIALEHNTFEHFGFGLGVNSNRLNFIIKNEGSGINFFGDIRIDYTGLLLYAKYYF